MPKEKLISVIIPVYNVKDYLRQCLDSVIGQSFRQLEIIVVDDGSTDGSGAICDAYARTDDRIRVYHTENRGLASARNYGLDRASGAYLFFADSDDWMDENAMSLLLETAAAYDADIAVGRICREWKNKTVYPAPTEKIRVLHGEGILSAFADGLFSDVAWNKLYRAEVFSQLRFPDGKNYEDNFTTYKLMKTLSENNGTAVIVSDAPFHFRARKSSISHTLSLKNTVDYWTANREKYDALAEYRIELLQRCVAAIGRMWVRYAGFSKQEKEKAQGVLAEMQGFAKAHFREVMAGKYPFRIKIISIAALCRNRLWMRLLFAANQLRTAFGRLGWKMYD